LRILRCLLVYFSLIFERINKLAKFAERVIPVLQMPGPSKTLACQCALDMSPGMHFC
jgi:hypothetical protein